MQKFGSRLASQLIHWEIWALQRGRFVVRCPLCECSVPDFPREGDKTTSQHLSDGLTCSDGLSGGIRLSHFLFEQRRRDRRPHLGLFALTLGNRCRSELDSAAGMSEDVRIVSLARDEDAVDEPSTDIDEHVLGTQFPRDHQVRTGLAAES